MKSLQNTKYDTKESKQDTKEGEEDKTEVWQLQLLDMADEEQEELVYGLLCKQPKLIEYYLHNFIFPETMENQGMRLCATGQALGGDLLFGRRLGFSGTLYLFLIHLLRGLTRVTYTTNESHLCHSINNTTRMLRKYLLALRARTQVHRPISFLSNSEIVYMKRAVMVK